MSIQPLPFADGAIVIQNDARSLPLGDASVDLVVTSPPYFALRSYRDDGEHYDGQIGSEATPQQFVYALSECMVEWRRVLKPSGSVWVNLGDKYAGSGGHNNAGIGADPVRGPRSYIKQSGRARAKSLMGLPWRFAIAQIDAGWILRAEVVWSKPNSLPESVTDRVRRSHEQWFHFTKEPLYYSAVDEIRDAYQSDATFGFAGHAKNYGDDRNDNNRNKVGERSSLGRVPGSVWTIPTEPLIVPDEVRAALDLPDHFAAFPQEWPRRIILGWSPSGICVECGEGRRPQVERSKDVFYGEGLYRSGAQQVSDGAAEKGFQQDEKWTTQTAITGEQCACDEPTAATTPAVILDPFGGTGTVAGVARTLGRFGISNDLSADYNRLAIWRIFDSGHFTKTEQRTWADRQTTMTTGEPS